MELRPKDKNYFHTEELFVALAESENKIYELEYRNSLSRDSENSLRKFKRALDSFDIVSQ
jgi:hypothetical protein